ncbi:uncharacterized protein L969DRAFT_408898 [Mixia osmundae IAM 14324]|uniref:BOD1/SHG1 domain-containing protein n=1 Tax=Mixia osmundae (strain CBS 9802 / IAM 14324 / JCM 22182 / KY 12970) TaxID=764103 RepID=G7E8U2_MIXOS|nr:uncharacterized protein L969DRAFT_408898 [Mixia osmundae IAM 14324]KEI40196.1 hypothetical protein L969DRAFT_408898 [Mixia osmundae IAM 14324]GAA99560.1 hypothetical protein E5Q_06261 [Mixia osmundae IAM 14324]
MASQTGPTVRAICTPQDLVDAYKRKGMFDKLRKEMMLAFLSNDSKAVFVERIDEIVRQKLESDQRLSSWPRNEAQAELMREVERHTIYDRAVSQMETDYLRPKQMDAELTTVLQDNRESVEAARKLAAQLEAQEAARAQEASETTTTTTTTTAQDVKPVQREQGVADSMQAFLSSIASAKQEAAQAAANKAAAIARAKARAAAEEAAKLAAEARAKAEVQAEARRQRQSDKKALEPSLPIDEESAPARPRRRRSRHTVVIREDAKSEDDEMMITPPAALTRPLKPGSFPQLPTPPATAERARSLGIYNLDKIASAMQSRHAQAMLAQQFGGDNSDLSDLSDLEADAMDLAEAEVIGDAMDEPIDDVPLLERAQESPRGT